jgi:hypothetical protein
VTILASKTLPTDTDALAVHESLRRVRLFVGRLSGVRIVVRMAFFEGLIQRFMPYLAFAAIVNFRIIAGWASRTSSRRFSTILDRAASDLTASQAPVIQ